MVTLLNVKLVLDTKSWNFVTERIWCRHQVRATIAILGYRWLAANGTSFSAQGNHRFLSNYDNQGIDRYNDDDRWMDLTQKRPFDKVSAFQQFWIPRVSDISKFRQSIKDTYIECMRNPQFTKATKQYVFMNIYWSLLNHLLGRIQFKWPSPRTIPTTTRVSTETSNYNRWMRSESNNLSLWQTARLTVTVSRSPRTTDILLSRVYVDFRAHIDETNDFLIYWHVYTHRSTPSSFATNVSSSVVTRLLPRLSRPNKSEVMIGLRTFRTVRSPV